MGGRSALRRRPPFPAHGIENPCRRVRPWIPSLLRSFSFHPGLLRGGPWHPTLLTPPHGNSFSDAAVRCLCWLISSFLNGRVRSPTYQYFAAASLYPDTGFLFSRRGPISDTINQKSLDMCDLSKKQVIPRAIDTGRFALVPAQPSVLVRPFLRISKA